MIELLLLRLNYMLTPTQLVKFSEDDLLMVSEVLKVVMLKHFKPEITQLTSAHYPTDGIPMKKRYFYSKSAISAVSPGPNAIAMHRFGWLDDVGCRD